MRAWKCMLGILLAALLLSGCASVEQRSSGKGRIKTWFLNAEENGLVYRDYEGEASSDEEFISDFLIWVCRTPQNTDYLPLLEENVKIRSHTLKDGILTLDFSASYKEMSATREVLARGGIVRTFAQLETVRGVYFEIEGEEAVSPSGTPLGLMNEDSFVEDAGKQINTIQHVAINLYFTGESGSTLKREARSIYYTSSKPLEWAIVERIIAGPKVDGNYPTVPANTQIISVTSANGICYVNLNQTFLTNALNIEEQIPIYSIVNSLIDDCKDIDQVQFSVEGDSGIIFKQTMDLSHPYEADYTLVEAAPSKNG